MSCPYGCEDGWVYDGAGGARACDCQRHKPTFRGDYHPAGRSAGARFRDRQRTRARRSVIKRRQLAKGKPPRRRERTLEIALGHAYPKMWQLDAAEFEAHYQATCDREGWTFDRRGLNTAWELYTVLWRRYRVEGQDFELTNAQLSIALDRRGRPRARRTVQLTRKRLQTMGVFHFEHVKRGTWRRDTGWRPGARKDTVRATVLHVRRLANCTPPTGAGASTLRVSASCSPGHKKVAEMTVTDSSPPPSAADWGAAPLGGEQQITERERLERQIDFQQLKLAQGWGRDRALTELARLRQSLRLLDQASQGHASARARRPG